MLKTRDINILLRSAGALDIIFGSATALSQLLSVAGAEIAASDPATVALCKNPNGIYTVVTNTAYLDLWQNVSANKTRMQAQINATGSALCRASYSAGATWTRPTGGILALALSNIGNGGSGGTPGVVLGQLTGGQGGTGGEIKTQQFTSSLPSGNITVSWTGSAVQFGSYLSASYGNNGVASSSSNNGPGFNSGTFYDTAFQSAIWQPNTAQQKGADGGGGAPNSGINGSAGSAGLTGSGGSGGTANAGSGGNATGISSGGGGSAVGGTSGGYGTGYSGQTGQITAHWIKAVP